MPPGTSSLATGQSCFTYIGYCTSNFPQIQSPTISCLLILQGDTSVACPSKGYAHSHTAYHKPLQPQNSLSLVSTKHTPHQGATITPVSISFTSSPTPRPWEKKPTCSMSVPSGLFRGKPELSTSTIFHAIPFPRTYSWPPPPPPPNIWPSPKSSQPLSVSGMDGARPLIRNTRQHRIVYSCWDSRVTVPLTRMAGCYQRTSTPRGHGHVAHARALSLISPVIPIFIPPTNTPLSLQLPFH